MHARGACPFARMRESQSHRARRFVLALCVRGMCARYLAAGLSKKKDLPRASTCIAHLSVRLGRRHVGGKE